MTAGVLPVVRKRQLALFANYLQFYLRRNFHALHLLRLAKLEQLHGAPLLICSNHPSWWDPLLGIYLNQRFFANRRSYAPIAAKGLEKYRFFERLGFFGINPDTRSGAARFLRIGGAVLDETDGALWVTPQGEFTDVRVRPVSIASGVGHLAHRASSFAMLPLAFEYSFWNERFPEAFACFGQPVLVDQGGQKTSREWTTIFASALETTQRELSERVSKRDSRAFEPLLGGRAGVGGLYHAWQATKAKLQKRVWRPEHGMD